MSTTNGIYQIFSVSIINAVEVFSRTYIIKSFESNNTHNTGLKDPNFA